MKKILTILLTICTLSMYGQSFYKSFSINTECTYMIPKVGITATIEDKLFQWQLGMSTTTNGEISNDIKAGFTIHNECKSKFILYPIWLHADWSSLEMRFNHSFMWIRPINNKLVFSLGADIWVDKSQERLWPTNEGQFTWTPTLSIQYAMIGKRYEKV